MVRLSVGFRSIRSIGGIFPLLKILYAGIITDLMGVMICRLLSRFSGKEHKRIYLGGSSNGQNCKTKDLPDTTQSEALSRTEKICIPVRTFGKFSYIVEKLFNLHSGHSGQST